MSGTDPAPTQEWSRPLTSGALNGAELIKAAYVTHEFPVHAHSQYVIGAVLRGAKLSRHGARDLVVTDGTAMLLNPFEEHTTRSGGSAWTYAAVYPTPQLIEQWLEGEASAFNFTEPLVSDHRLIAALLALYDAVGEAATPLEVQTRFLALTARLPTSRTARTNIEGSVNRATIARMRELLDTDLAANVDLADVAAAAALPRLTALREFRRQVGCTPHVYRTSRRIDAARSGLMQGHAIVDVAAGLGYCDQSHFSRTFRRWTGMTPYSFAQTRHQSAAPSLRSSDPREPRASPFRSNR